MSNGSNRRVGIVSSAEGATGKPRKVSVPAIVENPTLSNNWPQCVGTPSANVRQSNPKSSPSDLSIAPRSSPSLRRFCAAAPSPAPSILACAIPPAPGDGPSARPSPASLLRHDARPFPGPSFPAVPPSWPLHRNTTRAGAPSTGLADPCFAALPSPRQIAAAPSHHPSVFPIPPAPDPPAASPNVFGRFANTDDNCST